MGTDAVDLSPPLPRGDDVDHHGGLIDESQHGSGAEVGDDRPVATGERRRHHPRPLPGGRKSDRVDAAENAVEAPGIDGVGDRFIAHANRAELLPRHHSMLPRREPGERVSRPHSPDRIGVPFAAHSGQKEQ
jgi:hypothetical protein